MVIITSSKWNKKNEYVQIYRKVQSKSKSKQSMRGYITFDMRLYVLYLSKHVILYIIIACVNVYLSRGHSKSTFVVQEMGGGGTKANRRRGGQAYLYVRSVKKLPNFQTASSRQSSF